MGEQARDFKAAPVAWTLGVASGHPVVSGRVGAHFPGGVAAGDSRVGSHPGGFNHRHSGSGGGAHVDHGGNRTPEWYKWLVGTISGLSVLLLLTFLILEQAAK
jgi:hypothetical protein